MATPFGLSGGAGGPGLRALLMAADAGDLNRLKGIVKGLGRRAVPYYHKALALAARQGSLEMCKYLVEELGADVNNPVDEGLTSLMSAVQSDDVPTVEYLLDHGGDLMRVDDHQYTALHHAAHAGCCKVTEFLLSKRSVPADIDGGKVTPLFVAAIQGRDQTLKILLDHHANPNAILCGISTPLVGAFYGRSIKCMDLLIKAGADINGKCPIMSPLVLATVEGGYTDIIPFLLNAGADPNIPNDIGKLPIEHAALRGCREEVEMLFPLTSPIPNVPNWSIDGVISHTQLQKAKPVDQQQMKRCKDFYRSKADGFFKEEEYDMASKFYELATRYLPVDATIYANRSLCRLLMGDGEGALSDATVCRTIRPNWAIACYRQGAAHMLLEEYKLARDAFLDAQKLDPGSVEIQRELSKATELMKKL